MLYLKRLLTPSTPPFALLLRERIRLGKKVIVITSGMGNDLLAFSYAYNPLNLLLDQKDRKSLGHLQMGESFFGSQFDIKSQFIIRKPGEGGTHYNDLFSYPDDVTDFQDNYLSTRYKLNRIVTPNGRNNYQTSNLMLVDLVEELAWKLGNNDQSCCEGLDGRFYRKNLSEEPSQIFVSSTSQIDKEIVVNSNDKSQICGEVRISKLGNADTIYLEKSKISGSGTINIRGNVAFENSIITNPYENLAMNLENSNTTKSLVFRDSTINGNPTFKGPVNFIDSKAFDAPFVSTEILNTPDGDYSSTIFDTTISENSDFKGFYTINGRQIFNTYIEGKTDAQNGYQGSLVIDSSTGKNEIKNSHFEGFGYFAGSIYDGFNANGEYVDGSVFLKGERVGNVVSGINVDSNASVTVYADLRGTLLLDGNTNIEGTWNGDVIKQGQFIGHATDSYLKNVVVLGAPRIIDTSFNSGEIVRGSSTQNPFICESNFNSWVRVSCNAAVRRESQIQNYGCGYISNSDCLNPSQTPFLDRIERRKWGLIQAGNDISNKYAEMLLKAD